LLTLILTSETLNEKAEMRQSSRGTANSAVKGGKTSSKDRKLALQQDVMA